MIQDRSEQSGVGWELHLPSWKSSQAVLNNKRGGVVIHV